MYIAEQALELERKAAAKVSPNQVHHNKIRNDPVVQCCSVQHHEHPGLLHRLVGYAVWH
jgi:hypothetical protein